MFDKYFAEFHVPEQELKEEIHSLLRSLSILEPEQFSPALLEFADPNLPSQEIFLNLTSYIPELSSIASLQDELELMEGLRLTGIALSMLLNGKRLEHYFIKLLYMSHANLFLGLRYRLASDILTQKLNKQLLYDSATINSILENETHKPDKQPLVIIASKVAQQEIDRLVEDAGANEYVQHIRDVEAAIEKYIRDNCFSVVTESFSRLILEAFLKNAEIINAEMQQDERLLPSEARELTANIFKTIQQNTNYRLGRKRGGRRERKRFSWTDEKKAAFYKKVESLPKIKKRSCWQFALDELIEQEFDAETTNWLQSHVAFRELPEGFFKNAVKVWRKYLERENWKEMKAEEKPRAFAYRHALYLLGYPEHFAFSTLSTHYSKGKKVASDNQSDL